MKSLGIKKLMLVVMAGSCVSIGAEQRSQNSVNSAINTTQSNREQPTDRTKRKSISVKRRSHEEMQIGQAAALGKQNSTTSGK